MFGYVLPKGRTLSRRDFSMFQATYCGICMQTKRKYGQLARLTTNYDMTVFELLVMEAIRPDVEFATGRCILDPRRKVYVGESELNSLIVDVNILLCHYKLRDDVVDGGGKKRLMMRVLRKPYAAAKERLPECDEAISSGYAALRAMELAGVRSLDRTSDCFAGLLEKLFVAVVARLRDKAGGSDALYESAEVRLADDSTYMHDMRRLCYNIGKFVYLADALDDVAEDYAAKRYNPILAVWPDYDPKRGRAAYVEAHRKELGFAFASTVNRAIESFNRLPLTHVGDLLRNIIYEGLRAKTDELFAAKKKLPPPVLHAPPKEKTEKCAAECANDRCKAPRKGEDVPPADQGKEDK